MGIFVSIGLGLLFIVGAFATANALQNVINKANGEGSSTQPTTRRVTYVTDEQGWLKKVVYEEETSDVVAGYASRMGKDE